ncbi:MAG: polysaccharide biosynthesis protein [Nanoarchaeota archaeon]|nr:polysaccharide biosynthesis protein [Nanoarchaeota archaeon]
MKSFENKTILITGGTGTIGQAVTRYLLNENVKKIKIISRNEFKQHETKIKFNNSKIEFIICDVRDYTALNSVMQDVNIVFHTAAMKRIEICEKNTQEAIKTNIVGTMNVINAAGNNNVETVVNMSTDKAVKPDFVYGTTKNMAEKLIVNANKKFKTKFVNIRSSNVTWSTGNVFHIFYEKLMNNEEITVFGENMIRLFVNPEDIAKQFHYAYSKGQGGETFVILTNSIRISELAKAMQEIIGKGKITLKDHLRPGERFEEILIYAEEVERAFKTGNYVVIMPKEEKELMQKYAENEKFNMEYYSTHNSPELSIEEIKKYITLTEFSKI